MVGSKGWLIGIGVAFIIIGALLILKHRSQDGTGEETIDTKTEFLAGQALTKGQFGIMAIVAGIIAILVGLTR